VQKIRVIDVGSQSESGKHYRFCSRLYVAIVYSLGSLSNSSREPSKSFCEGSHRIFLEFVNTRNTSGAIAPRRHGLPNLAKYASFFSFPGCAPIAVGLAGDCDLCCSTGVWDLETGFDPVDAVCFFSPLTYVVPSTFAVNRSFHSSPTSPLYRSAIVLPSNVLPSILLISCASKNFFQGWLPPFSMRRISAVLKASMLIERTKEMWTPRPRWVPAQVRQMKVENLGEACCHRRNGLGFRFVELNGSRGA
jgi:hypothetical protein